jgi:MYXO-CTERM domain-containing protein
VCGLACADGTVQCDRACVDLQTDLLNCGSCGNACSVGQTCSQGVCVGTPTGGDPSVPTESVTPSNEEDSGCACATSRRTTASGWLALAFGLLFFARRRRRRR